MKTLLLIRHAKSDWADASLNDFDRPLNERGKRDAPAMVQRLLDKKISIDAFISSPAKRARKTAGIFAKEYKQGKENIILKEELYGAASAVFFDVVAHTDNSFESSTTEYNISGSNSSMMLTIISTRLNRNFALALCNNENISLARVAVLFLSFKILHSSR